MPQLPKKRYDENIKTRNFRLSYTSAYDTDFRLDDKRTGIQIKFSDVNVGKSLGRGDTVTLTHDGVTVGSVYQHDLCEHLLQAFRSIEESGELPEADYVKEEL
jgi:hypothetical protein